MGVLNTSIEVHKAKGSFQAIVVHFTICLLYYTALSKYSILIVILLQNCGSLLYHPMKTWNQLSQPEDGWGPAHVTQICQTCAMQRYKPIYQGDILEKGDTNDHTENVLLDHSQV